MQALTLIPARVHAILAKHGIANEHCDLFGKSGRKFLGRLELRTLRAGGWTG